MGKWMRIASGMYKRVGSDGESILAIINKNRNHWDVVIYPYGKGSLQFSSPTHRTLAVAKASAETLYRNYCSKNS